MPLYPPATGSGAGDITGPGSSVNTDVAIFSGTTGKVISDSGILIANVARRDAANTFNGAILFSPDNTYNIGASLATRPANIFLANNLIAGGSISAVSGSVTNLTITGGNISLNTGTVFISDIVFSGSRTIRTNSADGSDTNSAVFTGGGGVGDSRGPYVASYGNEHGSAPGTLQLGAGNSATGGHIDFYTGAGVLQGRMWKSGGFTWGGSVNDPGDNNFRVEGTSTLVGTITCNAITANSTISCTTITTTATGNTNHNLFGTSFVLQPFDVNNQWISDNVYYNSGFLRKVAGYGCALYFSGGNILFRTAISSTAGSAVSWIDGLTITNVGNITTFGSINGQTISNASSFTGTITAASGIFSTLGQFQAGNAGSNSYIYYLASNSYGNFYMGQESSTSSLFGQAAGSANLFCTHGNGMNIMVAASGTIRFCTSTSTLRMKIHNSGCLSLGIDSDLGGAGTWYFASTGYVGGHIHLSYQLYPGVIGSPGIQGSYYLGADNTYGLRTSHGLYVNGGLTVNGGIVGTAGSTWTQGPFSNGSAFFYQLNGAMALGVAGSGGTHNSFWNVNGQVGYISSSGTVTTYSTSSDERLKEDLGIFNDPEVLVRTKIHMFKWKTDGTFGKGVFAQEAILVNPVAVTKGDDELDERGYPKKSWGVDYSKYVPDLIIGWQEHEARLRTLEEMVRGIE